MMSLLEVNFPSCRLIMARTKIMVHIRTEILIKI